MKPLVSIIIPTYNHGDLLAEAIDSCMQQTHKHVELIIIDDGSKDNTREVYSQKFSRIKNIRYVYQKNKGVSVARNKGIKLSKGDYIQFLDADDLLLDTKLEVQLEHLMKLNASAVHSDFYFMHGITNKRLEKFSEPHTNKKSFLIDLILRWEYGFSIPCHCFLFRKKEISKMRFNRRLVTHEDWEFYVRWVVNGNWSEFLDSELCIYRVYPESLSKDKQKMRKGYLKALSYIAKNSMECSDLVKLRIEKDDILI